MACSDSITDERDGQSYDVVQVGNATWMAENLNFEMAGSFCPDGEARNCNKYGRLYTWESARAACPAGWALPTRNDFEQLIAAAEQAGRKAGEALKATSGWFKKGNGTDDLHFGAIPAGFVSGDKFDGIGGYAHLWSASPDSVEPAFAQYLYLDFSSDVARISSFSVTDGRSVRCVKY